ncbi:zinc finger CCCH domain-containing protein 19 [Phtheirospermum japonicum]|uniref:Zinc finger CCCH domain-containing protein 19 n=1 Tax=Phtheirospermum japonicum TaxID=374723 RepID=A0A830BH93_9LAMI|nr:zinc finger CCCH domain-containing protein 19 [Phtheirospermum japonicum]
MENINTLLAAVAQTQGFDDEESSRAVKDGSGDAHPSAVVDVPPTAPTPAFPALGPVIGTGEKRKRGRPYGQIAAKPPPLKRNKQEDEDEDVCFICFDGGSLVLCDRKKASHYLCYTCTYSLCKGCIKDADYSCVRRNKGFCSTCMKTIMLIENKDLANNESVKVDFDDQTSWEYLFKVYWVILKEKLSLRLDELTQAQNPWKAVATVDYKPLLHNAVPSVVSLEVPISYNSTEHLELNKPHVEFSLPQNETPPPSTGINVEKLNNDTGNEITVETGIDKVTVETVIGKVTVETVIDKVTDVLGIKEEASHEPGIEKGRDEVSIVQDTEKKCICKHTNNKEPDKLGIDSSTEWATKDLLEFVAHTKNGDTSAISQFDVQTLLLDYIKRNNLRDPRRKSQIICDQRLRNLFGKPRVGHIEMLKLLEFHFLVKEDSKKNSFIPAGFVSSAASEMEVNGNTNGLPLPIKSRKRKTRKKSDERAPPQNNLSEYAAVDVHNINLIYLRRNLMENLIDDRENFNNKVIGAIVRIRISSNEQKQDVHRLVQVVGTTKVGEPYKVGNRSADVMLEVLNLDKKEVVSIDAISNQEFTEDECQRLRQSIRCGLVKQFTVGEVQNKAMVLQPVRVNDLKKKVPSRHGVESGLETSTASASIGNSPSSSSVIETEKLWHYRDPNGKIQGPFSMMQLRKWSTTGLFPSDMRIWTNHEQYDSLLLTDALNGKFNLASDLSNSRPREEEARLISEVTNVGSKEVKQTEPALGSNVSVSSENNDSGLVKAAESGSWPQCWDLLKDNSNSDVSDIEARDLLKDNSNSSINDVEARDLLHSSSPEKTGVALPDPPPGPEKSEDLHHGSQNGEKSSSGLISENLITNGPELQNQSNNENRVGVLSEENSKSLNFDLSSNDMECGSVYVSDLDKQIGNLSVLDFPSPTPKPVEIAQSEVPMQNFEILELLSPTPRSNNEDQATEKKQTGLLNISVPNSGQIWSSASSLGLSEVQLPEVDAEWCGYSPTPAKPPEVMSDNIVATASTSNVPNWLMTINGTIELGAFDEESVSDLLAEVDAMESQGALPSPTSAMKFARELMEDCKDDCFSSIEEFSRKSDAFSSTGEIQLNSESSVPCKPIGAPSMNTFDYLTRSSVHSSASSEGETNAPVYSGDAGSEFHPGAPNMTQDIMVGGNVSAGMGSDNVDPGWGSVQGNINLVTVQGNVNLVLGGPAGQGMANIGWGTNQGTGWANPNLNLSPRNGSLPWDCQRKYGGERFNSPREWGGYQGSDSGFGRGPRPLWGRQPPYGGGGYLRPFPKGQRIIIEQTLDEVWRMLSLQELAFAGTVEEVLWDDKTGDG